MPALTPARIADAALAEISAHGRSSLSMRRLASALGCEAMSLYHHVEGVDGVLDAVVDRMLESLVRQTPEREPRAALQAYAKSYLQLAETYPQAFPLVATRLWRTPNALAAAGTAVALLRKLGLSPRAALRQARILGAYLNGAGLALAAWSAGEASGARAAADNPELASLAGSVNAASVRADLETGLKIVVAGIVGQF